MESAASIVPELLHTAWNVLNPKDGSTLDPDLDLPAGKKPKWTSHSLWRLADTVARRYQPETEVTAQQIDIYLGWHEKIL